MTHARPDLGPERGPVGTATFTESDESFLRWFEEDPGLNEFANARAADVCVQWNALLAETGHQPITDQGTAFHFEVKKWLFLFTDPDKYTDTPDDRELWIFFLSAYVLAGKDTRNVLPTLSRLAARADTADIDRLAQGPVAAWNLLTYREKFWMVQGALFSTEDRTPPNIPAQAQRT